MGKDLNGKELGKNLSQRKDGRYEAKYTDNFGKRHSIYGEKLSEVRKKLTDALYEVEHNIYNRDAKFTVDEWFEVYIKHCEAKRDKVTTINLYRQSYGLSISPNIGHMLLQDVKQIHVQNMFAMYTSKYCLTTQKLLKGILIGMFKLAVDNDFIIKSPIKSIILTTNKDNKEKRFLTEEEQKVFLSFVKNKTYYCLFCFLILTGCRIGEVLALNWEDIDFDNKIIKINKTLSRTYDSTKRTCSAQLGTPKTKASNREIPIHPTLLKIIKEMKRYSDEIVFATKKGKRIQYSAVRESIKRTVDRANSTYPELKMKYFSPHSLRHTFASNCFDAGISPKIVQELLGHSRIDITMDLYTHISEKHKKDSINKLHDSGLEEFVVKLSSNHI